MAMLQGYKASDGKYYITGSSGISREATPDEARLIDGMGGSGYIDTTDTAPHPLAPPKGGTPRPVSPVINGPAYPGAPPATGGPWPGGADWAAGMTGPSPDFPNGFTPPAPWVATPWAPPDPKAPPTPGPNYAYTPPGATPGWQGTMPTTPPPAPAAEPTTPPAWVTQQPWWGTLFPKDILQRTAYDLDPSFAWATANNQLGGNSWAPRYNWTQGQQQHYYDLYADQNTRAQGTPEGTMSFADFIEREAPRFLHDFDMLPASQKGYANIFQPAGRQTF